MTPTSTNWKRWRKVSIEATEETKEETHEGETQLVLSHVLTNGVAAVVIVRSSSHDGGDWARRGEDGWVKDERKKESKEKRG
jgi:hypothetical protein